MVKDFFTSKGSFGFRSNIPYCVFKELILLSKFPFLNKFQIMVDISNLRIVVYSLFEIGIIFYPHLQFHLAYFGIPLFGFIEMPCKGFNYWRNLIYFKCVIF